MSIADFGFGSLQVLDDVSRYHMKRHEYLAGNLSNAETPGYLYQDVSFEDYLAKLDDLRSGDAAPGATPEVESFDVPLPAGDNGNNVSMEMVMGQLAANQIRHEATSELLSRRIGMLRYAATDGGT